MNLTTKQAIEAFRKLPQEQHDIILNGAELLAAKTGLPLTSCVHLIAECCLYVTYDGLSLTQANRGASERKR